MRVFLIAALVAVSLPAFAAAAGRLPSTVEPERYSLTFEPDLAAGTFRGQEVIEAQLVAATDRVVLNALGLTITQVTLQTGGVSEPARVSYDPAAETATFSPAHPLARGAVTIRLAFSGQLSHALRGLYAAKADGRRYAFTQFEPTDARRAFPCFDEPARKARFDVTAIVDAADSAIGNGAILSERLDPRTRKKTVRFAETAPMSTYLVALAVGPFEHVDGHAGSVPVRVYVTPGKTALAHYALGAAEAFLPELSSYFGIAYPFGKLDLVAVPDFEAGAMENTGAIFFREAALLVDAAHASAGARRRVALVLAHEMAHQWFGDLVTMSWWDDLWLNEAFATWMENKVVDAWRPGWRVWDDFTSDGLRVMDADALGSTHPIHQPVRTAAEANQAFDGITYAKGASVLRMIEEWLGEATFQRGIHGYLTAHAHGNTTAADLWRALAQASGKPVAPLARSWFGEAGHPVVSVSTRCEGGKGTVTLAQAREWTTPGRVGGTLWQVPVSLRWPGGEQKVMLEGPRMEVSSPGGCAAWLDAKAHGYGFFRVRYTAAAAAALGRAARRLEVPERLGLVADGWAELRAGQSSIADWLTLDRKLAGDESPAVIAELARGLSALDQYLVAAPERPAFARLVERTFLPAMRRIGWQPSPGKREADPIRLERASLLSALGGIGGAPAALQEASRDLGRALDDRAPLEATLADAVIPLEAKKGDAALYARYVERLRGARTPVEQHRFLMALAAFEAPALVSRTLALSLSPEVRTQDVTRLIASEFAQPGRQAAWAFVKANWVALTHRVPEYGLGRVVAATGQLCSLEDARDVERFFAAAAHRVPAGRRQVAQAVESIGICARMKTRDAAPLAAWLERSQ